MMRARWVFNDLEPKLPGVAQTTVASWWPGKYWLVSTIQLEEPSVRFDASFHKPMPYVEFIQPKYVQGFSKELNDARCDWVDIKIRIPIGKAVPCPGKFITLIFKCSRIWVYTMDCLTGIVGPQVYRREFRLHEDRTCEINLWELPLFEREYFNLSAARAGHAEMVDLLAQGRLTLNKYQRLEAKHVDDGTTFTADISEKPKGKSDAKIQPELPRMHHYNFAYKALPGLAFADPHVPLGFGDDTPKGSLAKFWNYVGSKLPERERVSSVGLQGTGGPFGKDYSIVLITMPKPERKTEAYYVAVVYPKSWFDSTAFEHSKPPAPYPVFFLLTVSDVPGSGGAAGATVRVLVKDGHGAVGFGIPVSEKAFLNEIEKIMDEIEKNAEKEPSWVTFDVNKLWNFFMQDAETGQTFGSD